MEQRLAPPPVPGRERYQAQRCDPGQDVQGAEDRFGLAPDAEAKRRQGQDYNQEGCRHRRRHDQKAGLGEKDSVLGCHREIVRDIE